MESTKINVSASNLTNLPKSEPEKSSNYRVEQLFNSVSTNLPKAPPTITALCLLEEELSNRSILSFNSELDRVLKDELVPGRITELAGFPGSGKTQICFQLSITAQLPKPFGGVEGQVIYISTNKNFASHRLRELSQKFIKQLSKVDNCQAENFSVESFLKNVYVFINRKIDEIFATTKYLEKFLEGKMVKLVVIDSIASPLRDVEPQERSTLIHKLLEELQHLAVSFKFAIVITNDFTTRICETQAYNTPSFGDTFFDRVNSRICLSRSSVNNIYLAELVKSVVKVPVQTKFYMF